MRFDFGTATRILFGSGALRESIGAITELGRRVLVVTGQNPDRAEPLLALLRKGSQIETWTLATTGEPTIQHVEDGARLARRERIDVVIGFGGGSAIDAAKAMAALATNDGVLLDYLEVIGRGQPLPRTPLPFVAIPTTAGTGAEVTRNAVLASPDHRVKASLRSPLMLARLAVVDPDLTLGLPPALTASTGLDALTQLIEPFVSVRANPLTDGFCREGLPRVARSLRRACAALFERTDIVVMPSVAALPWPASEAYPPRIDGRDVGPRGHAIYTGWVNAAGLPALAVPSAPSSQGLPIGIQLIGSYGSDDALLDLGAAYEADAPWTDRWPAL